jgi:hypothetical protein
MSSEKLYYKKYLKYKQKYKILQMQIGGTKIPIIPLIKNKSLTYTNQGSDKTCTAHTIARLFANLIKLFLLNNFDYIVNCSYFYNTIECKKNLTIFDCFSIKKIDNCDNYQEHISALLFHFIYVIIIEQYGCVAAPMIVILYFINYIKKTKITSKLIIKKLNYDSNTHSNYLYLIEKLNDIINKAKSNLFNYKLSVYGTPILERKVFEVYKYDSDSYFTIYENHALSELYELKNILIYILNNGYYATFSYDEHIVIITDYDATNDALVIKDSYGEPTESDMNAVTNWCPIINNNIILFTDLLNEELNLYNKWEIFFIYSTIKPTPIMLFPNFESRLETIKKKIIQIKEYISTKTLRQKIDVNDIEEDLKYINSILNAIHSIKVTRSEIEDVEKNLKKLIKDSNKFNKTIDFNSLTPSALGSKLLSYFRPVNTTTISI